MILNDVTQRRLERYQEALLEKASESRSAARFNRAVIEAATIAGIAEGAPDEMGDMTPRDVESLTKRIQRHIEEATKPLPGEA